jgi:AAHS family 4-hydroxybenzoate transporter-like MFS transporter
MEMSKTRRIDISALIDANKLSRFQVWVLAMAALTVVVDGFDVFAMAFVAPALVRDWGIDKAALGPVFGAGLFGMLIGSLGLSVLADRIGRRPVLIFASLFFAVCTLATTQVTTLHGLLAIRFIAGLGLGAIMPNAMALAAEFSPKSKRVTLMMFVSCGFTAGAIIGGLLSALMIPAWGWQSVFYLGGIVPLAIGLLMVFQMPESMQFLVLRGRGMGLVAKSLRRIDASVAIDDETQYVVQESRHGRAPMIELFADGRARTTLLLWVINFMNLLILYFLSDWIPTIAKSAGYSMSTSVLLGTSLLSGGLIGTLLMGPAIDRMGFFKVLIPSFIVAAFGIAAIGQSAASLPWLFAVVTLTGFCVIGGQPAVNALAGSFYPTALRSTGIGWSLGIGRIGSIIGPVLGGQLIHLDWSNSQMFIAVAVPALISAVMLYVMANSRTALSPRSERLASYRTDTPARSGA